MFTILSFSTQRNLVLSSKKVLENSVRRRAYGAVLNSVYCIRSAVSSFTKLTPGTQYVGLRCIVKPKKREPLVTVSTTATPSGPPKSRPTPSAFDVLVTPGAAGIGFIGGFVSSLHLHLHHLFVALSLVLMPWPNQSQLKSMRGL